MKVKPLFSSISGEWQTPHDLFDKLWKRYGPFDLDPCCRFGQYTAKRVLDNAGRIFVPPGDGPGWPGKAVVLEDGLRQSWNGRVYMNPPYGREITAWVSKAYTEVAFGDAELVAALLPARTDTQWWQDHIIGSIIGDADAWDADATRYLAEVHFLAGRLRFVGGNNSAPFPSAIVVWRK